MVMFALTSKEESENYRSVVTNCMRTIVSLII